MATVKVALFNGNIDSLKKNIIPVHWNKGTLSIIRLPASVSNATTNVLDGNEPKLIPVEYHEFSNVPSNSDPSSEYGLFFYSAPIPPTHLKSLSSSSINATDSRIHPNPDNVYDELPITEQEVKIHTKPPSLKHSKSKEKHKPSKSSSPSPVSNNQFGWDTHSNFDSLSLKPFLLLPLYPATDEKSISSFMSPVQDLHKSLKAGFHYPKWVGCFIVFNGYFNASQSIFSLLTTESMSVSKSQPVRIQPTKVSLKQKLFGNRQKRSSPLDLSNKHVIPVQKSEFPLMIGFPNSHVAHAWWERIHNILIQKKQIIHSAPLTQDCAFFAKDRNQNDVSKQKCSGGKDDEDLDGSYASLPLRNGQSVESLHSTGPALVISDKIQRARASKKNMLPNPISHNVRNSKLENQQQNNSDLKFSSTLLNESSIGETSLFSLLSLPSSFLLQVLVPHGLRLLIEREKSLLHFDILTASIVRYSFFEDIFLIELGELCLLSPDKELIFQVDRIQVFANLFTKLTSASSFQPSSDEYSFTSSPREPPKPQLMRHINRALNDSSSMSEDIYNPDNNIYAELHRPQLPRNSSTTDEADHEIEENHRIQSGQIRVCNESVEDEDPYNEGTVNEFL